MDRSIETKISQIIWGHDGASEPEIIEEILFKVNGKFINVKQYLIHLGYKSDTEVFHTMKKSLEEQYLG